MHSALLLLLGLLGFSALLLLSLAGLVMGRKAMRDRREAYSRQRRDRYVAAVRDASTPADVPASEFSGVLRDGLEQAFASVRSLSAQLDLIAALHATPSSRGALADAAERSGLLDDLDRQLRSRTPSTRGRAVMLLGRLHPNAAERLRQALSDPDPDVRLVACAALADSREPAAVDVLLEALDGGRFVAERVIERIGAPWAVDALLRALERPDAPATTRLACARALGLAADRRAEPALLALLQTGTDEERISAARSLADVGGHDCVNALEAALEDPSWPLRAQAAKALGALRPPQSVASLEAHLADSAWWVRANAAQALLGFGDEGIAALKRATEHTDGYARDRAIETLSMARLVAA